MKIGILACILIAVLTVFQGKGSKMQQEALMSSELGVDAEITCDETIAPTSCGSGAACANRLNAALNTSSATVCLERGATYHISCSAARETVPQEKAYVILIEGVSNVTLVAFGRGSLKAKLMIEYGAVLCGGIFVKDSQNISILDIEIDAHRSVSTLVQMEGVTADGLILKVQNDTSDTSYDFTGYNSTQPWLKNIASMKPVEHRPGGDVGSSWRYVIDEHYYSWKKNPLQVSSWNSSTRTVSVGVTDASELQKFQSIQQGRYFIIRSEDYGYNGFQAFNSTTLVLTGVHVYTTPGMGFVFWICHGIKLQGCGVRKRGNRAFSVASDGVMTRSCTGTLEVSDGVFEGHGDDSLNIRHQYDKVHAFNPDGDGKSVTIKGAWAGAIPFSTGHKVSFQVESTLADVFHTTVSSVRCEMPSQNCIRGWFACCQGGWGNMILTLADQLPSTVSTGQIVVLPDFVPEKVLIRDATFKECRCKGIIVTAGEMSSVVIRRNTVAATTGNAIFVENGPHGIAYSQGPFAKDTLIEGNIISVESDATALSGGGYRDGWVSNAGGVQQNWAPIFVGATVPDAGGEPMFYTGSPLYVKLNISGNEVTLGGRARPCPKARAYCNSAEFYQWFPSFAISVDAVQHLIIERNTIADKRTTWRGTRVVTQNCMTCTDMAPAGLTNRGMTCKTVDATWHQGLQQRCDLPTWRRQNFCSQSCANIGYGRENCCTETPPYIRYSNCLATDLGGNTNLCDGAACSSANVR